MTISTTAATPAQQPPSAPALPVLSDRAKKLIAELKFATEHYTLQRSRASHAALRAAESALCVYLAAQEAKR